MYLGCCVELVGTVLQAIMSVIFYHHSNRKNGRSPMRFTLTFAYITLFLVALSSCQSTDALNSVVKEERGRVNIAGPLGPFKDSLFSYRAPLEVQDGGDFVLSPYDELIDINKRDEMPVRKVKSNYISRIPKAQILDFTYQGQNQTQPVFAVGKVTGNSSYTVIYLHGKGGSRKWGFDDERFGGNYNRLKNLMLQNGGAYLSPDFTNFKGDGIADITKLLEQQRRNTTGPLVLACGSLATKICWAIANSKQGLASLNGIVVLGGFPDRSFLRVAYNVSSVNIPIYIAHGSKDPVYSSSDMIDFYQALKVKDYPVRMTLFDTGNHGTPVRMIDWRQALNWISSKLKR